MKNGGVGPRVIGPIPDDRWEREIRRQLMLQLPHGWIVICSVAWALRRTGGYVRDGQCDFVVLAPGLGMVIVEVKGSRSVRVGADGTWYRAEFDGRTNRIVREVAIKESPPDQAARNMHSLAAIVRDQLPADSFPGAYAFMVAYPNGELAGELDLHDRSTVVTSSQIPELHRCLRLALEARGASSHGTSFTLDVVARVAKILSNSRFVIAPADTPLDAREDAADIRELTRQQFAALRGVFELPRVAVIGPAGSGKTMLALWKLSALLEADKRALYVCFNVALAERLRLDNPELAASIVSVDKLFAEIVGGRVRPDSDDYFQEKLPMQVLDVTGYMPQDKKYDAIIVDEGQDFGESRNIALLDLLTDDGQWLCFADQGQDVYGGGGGIELGAEVTFRLYHNCRNTERTNSAANQYCGRSIASMPGVPVGSKPRVVHSPARTMAIRAWDLAQEFSPEGGAVFLSPYRLAKSCMDGHLRGHGLELTQDLSKMGEPGFVFFSTIKSFKGLEAEHVIVVDAGIPKPSTHFSPEDLYVACTRAISRLAILVDSTEAYKWFSGHLK